MPVCSALFYAVASTGVSKNVNVGAAGEKVLWPESSVYTVEGFLFSAPRNSIRKNLQAKGMESIILPPCFCATVHALRMEVCPRVREGSDPNGPRHT